MSIKTGTEPETPLEKAALRALRTARWFVDGFRELPIEVEDLRRTRLSPTLERLEEGELFHIHDEPILDLLEKAVVKHLNGLREGYGSYALNQDTCYDELYRPDLDRGRILMEQWKSFKAARQHVIDLRRARIIADSFS